MIRMPFDREDTATAMVDLDHWVSDAVPLRQERGYIIERGGVIDLEYIDSRPWIVVLMFRPIMADCNAMGFNGFNSETRAEGEGKLLSEAFVMAREQVAGIVAKWPKMPSVV